MLTEEAYRNALTKLISAALGGDPLSPNLLPRAIVALAANLASAGRIVVPEGYYGLRLAVGAPLTPVFRALESLEAFDARLPLDVPSSLETIVEEMANNGESIAEFEHSFSLGTYRVQIRLEREPSKGPV